MKRKEDNHMEDGQCMTYNGIIEGQSAWMAEYAQDMRKDAIRQAKKAFENGRDQIYSALTAVNCVLSYARAEGLTSLSENECFRGGKPHVLDLIEKKEHRTVPLRQYLAFGLDAIPGGEMPRWAGELMVNRYHANRYAAREAFIAYIYFVGVIGVVYCMPSEVLMEYFLSVIPDEETDTFNTFAERLRNQDMNVWWKE